ncbi:MAG: GDSL-type esterase/lipase family protein [Bacteroidales bacterium]|nr:GDSL-type esterase/lipase family protein [Bacteroidales bacterium]
MTFSRYTIVTAISLLTSAISLAQTLDYINADANVIAMNGDNWSTLRSSLASLQENNASISILQIGDSHIQADWSASVVRQRLQSEFGNAGRGCIAALRLAGTNQPEDYRLSADTAALCSSRLLAKEWKAGMGVTGVAVTFASPEHRLKIATDAECGGFSSVTLLHQPGPGYATAIINDSLLVGEPVTPSATRYRLDCTVDSLSLRTSFDSPFSGAYLQRNSPGVEFNAIGNNGACFSSYLKIPDFAELTRIFSPSLIILSMGTNEAFGSDSDEQIYCSIDTLVQQLRKVHPSAKFLLTTPMECHKKVTRATRRRRRGRYRKTTAFVTNRRVAEVRNVILRYGRDHKLPVWDLYVIAGGEGASAKWIADGLMNPRDHVHCLKSGYELRGALLSDALLKQLKPTE